MKTYYAVVEKDPDSAFGVFFPDLPGVYSAADQESDILDKAIEALSLWAEDSPLPEASGLDDIRARPDVRDVLDKGAFLLRVPFVENDTRVRRANVTFEAGMLRAIDQEAKRRRLTRSAFLATAAKKEILHGHG